MCWEGRGEVGRKGEVCVEREGGGVCWEGGGGCVLGGKGGGVCWEGRGRCVLGGKGEVCVREGGEWTCIM